MRSMVILSSVILMTSCGALKFWEHNDQSSREVAGLGAQLLVPEEAQTISDEIEDKLMGLHSYYVIGQKNLVRFDQELGEHSIEKLYSSEAYLNLLAVRTQTEELEHELDDYYSKLKLSKSAQKARTRLFETKVTEFSMRSDLSHLSMQNLVHLSKIKLLEPAHLAVGLELRSF